MEDSPRGPAGLEQVDVATLRAVAGSLQDALIAVDSESRIMLWAAGAEAMFGLSPAEAMGRSLTGLMPERFRERHRAGMERAVAAGEARGLPGAPLLLAGLRRGGTEFPLELTLGRWRADDGAWRFTGVVRDVSDRVRADRVSAVQYGVAVALAASEDLDDGVTGALEVIAAEMDWKVAHLWTVDPASGVLRLRVAWPAGDTRLGAFGDASASFALRRGEGLLGQAWAAGAPLWMPDVTQERSFLRAALAREAGLRVGVLVPLVVDRATRGVVEFFGTDVRDRDDRLISVIETLGNQLAQFVLRREAEQGLRERELHQRQAAELNDEIVQGITLAHYHLQDNDVERASATISATLAAAKRIVDDLLADVDLEPGLLRRTKTGRLSFDEPE